ncbi:melanization protease 1-like [Contarinia nasturtii]|uniref:melanization protease 1-like n=1 Tax=Contarinia nasturtii TaxID=265458 RepID=UPI0012D492C5|nr:melanization protease 1-like [Contarinia nasturtii]
MDSLRQPEAQEIICEARKTSQINAKARYSLCQEKSSTQLINDSVELPKPGVCGSSQPSQRIVGGEETAINEFPWMAQIEYTKLYILTGKKTFYKCIGIIINENYILTGVRLGEWNTTSNPDCDDGQCADPVQDIRVVERIPHVDYNPDSESQGNDIALLRLERPITYTEWIKPICLPASSEVLNQNYARSKLILSGWGKTERGHLSNIKLKVNLDSVPIDRCSNMYSAYNATLTNKQLCAGGEKGKDACDGDMGGPLMKLHKTDETHFHYYVVGVTSFGRDPSGRDGWPGVYTRVDRYIDWIKANIKP